MRIRIISALLFFLLAWAASIMLLSGILEASWLPDAIAGMRLPASFAELGESMGLLDSLFASVAIVLGLVAILFQGREIKASADAQALQAAILSEQISNQEYSNRLLAYSTRLQFLTSQIEYLEESNGDIWERQIPAKERQGDAEEVKKLKDIVMSVRKKIRRYRKEAEEIDQDTKLLLRQSM